MAIISENAITGDTFDGLPSARVVEVRRRTETVDNKTGFLENYRQLTVLMIWYFQHGPYPGEPSGGHDGCETVVSAHNFKNSGKAANSCGNETFGPLLSSNFT